LLHRNRLGDKLYTWVVKRATFQRAMQHCCAPSWTKISPVLLELNDCSLSLFILWFLSQTLLKTTNSLLDKDLYTSLSYLKSNLNKGIAPDLLKCGVCGRQYSNDNLPNKGDTVIYRYVWSVRIYISIIPPPTTGKLTTSLATQVPSIDR
jgi:hypothetical protein